MKGPLRGSERRVAARTAACFLIFAPAVFSTVLEWKQNDERGEYDLKAAFIYNFTKFIEWPVESVPADKKTITIGIVGSDPFGDAIKNVEGKSVKDRTIVIKRFANAKSIEACDLLFVPAGEKDALASITKDVKVKNALIVGEHNGAATRGAIIGFYVEDKKLRFEINADAASASGFKVSSQLLKLAKIVKSAEPAASQPESKAASKPAVEIKGGQK